MNVTSLIEKCRNLGATFIPENDRLKIKAPKPLPSDIVTELLEAKPEIMAELRRQFKSEANCWLLEEWRRISIPEWRHILQDSIKTGNTYREEYARWMLGEVLEDSEYMEER